MRPRPTAPSFMLALVWLAMAAALPALAQDRWIEAEIDRTTSALTPAQQVGQLLVVGVPADIGNYSRSTQLRQFVELGVGNYVVYNYHYATHETDPQTAREQIDTFHRFIKRLYRDEGLPPPLLFTDFENATRSGLKGQPVHHPLSAMTLTATRDPDKVALLGRLVGQELTSLSIDAMLGPVLDIDGTPQDEPNNLLGNRSFGGTPQLVIGAAATYLQGLNQAGILTFLKHFPGHGFVKGDAHKKVYPEFKSSAQHLEQNLQPFRVLLPKATGLMTAHMIVERLDAGRLATFSREIVHDIVRGTEAIGEGMIPAFGRPEALVITDDLSDMGAIIHYIDEDKERRSFGSVASQALVAGHDLLLFSHVETPYTLQDPRRHRSQFQRFPVSAVPELIAFLTTWNQDDPKDYIDHVEPALRRVLRTKLRLLATWSGEKHPSLTDWDLPRDRRPGTPPRQARISKRAATRLLRDLARQALVEINRVHDAQPLDKAVQNGSGWIFYSPVCESNLGRALDDPAFAAQATKHKLVRSDKVFFEEARRKIDSAVTDGFDFLIFDAANRHEDKDLLLHLLGRTQTHSELRKKIFLFVHGTPRDLPAALLTSFNVYSNFAKGVPACSAADDMLHGLVTPRDVDHAPISLGKSNEIINARDAKIFPGRGSEVIEVIAGGRHGEELAPMLAELDAKLTTAEDTIFRLRMEAATLQDVVRRWSRYGGLALFLLSAGLFLYIVRKVIINTQVPEDTTIKSLLPMYLVSLIRGSARRATGFAASLAGLVLGVLLFSEIGPDEIIRFLEKQVQRRIEIAQEETATPGTATGAIPARPEALDAALPSSGASAPQMAETRPTNASNETGVGP